MSVFTNSMQEWISSLSINSVIMMIMMIFMLVGAIDKIIGNNSATAKNLKPVSTQSARWPSPWLA